VDARVSLGGSQRGTKPYETIRVRESSGVGEAGDQPALHGARVDLARDALDGAKEFSVGR